MNEKELECENIYDHIEKEKIVGCDFCTEEYEDDFPIFHVSDNVNGIMWHICYWCIDRRLEIIAGVDLDDRERSVRDGFRAGKLKESIFHDGMELRLVEDMGKVRDVIDEEYKKYKKISKKKLS